MSVHPLFRNTQGKQGLGRPTLSAQLIAEVRQALFEKRLKPGDFLGGEKDIADQRGVSRIVARDALRTLEALGIVEIKVGSGGGARIARGDPRRFAEALAVQLELAGVDVAEIMDAQRAVEMPRRRTRRRARDQSRYRAAASACSTPATKPSTTSPPSPATAPNSISPSPRPRITACSPCNSNRCSTSPGRARNPTLTREVALHVQSAHRDLVESDRAARPQRGARA